MATEKRLIDADEFLNRLENTVYDTPTDFGYTPGLIKTVLKQTKTVDAVEVVHGRWIPLEYDGFADGNPVWDLWECSECREEHRGEEDTLTPYCPNCGAKMDLKGE